MNSISASTLCNSQNLKHGGMISMQNACQTLPAKRNATYLCKLAECHAWPPLSDTNLRAAATAGRFHRLIPPALQVLCEQKQVASACSFAVHPGA